MINQVLYNLLGNAEKFTESGTITLEVEQVEREHELDLAFHVRDTGIGISADKVDAIFNEFSQENRETKLKYGGTGLGLAITKKIVELLNGQITVKSQKNVGSTFTVRLCLKNTGKPIRILENTSLAIENTSRILVVEDNVMNQNYISRLLGGQGLQFEIADNGQIAFDLCKKMAFDLIFMDISMPVMDGYETTIKIRNSNTSNKDTPIVALTASALSTKKSKAFDVGMNDYMTKPFTPFELKAKLAHFLGTLEDSQTTAEAAPQRETSPTVQLDRDVLAMYYDGDDAYAHDMFKMFLDQYQDTVDALTAAVKDQRWDEAQKLAHKMKPTFSMVGAPGIQTIFQDLENALRFNDDAQITANWSKAQDALKAYLPVIQAEYERLRSST